MSRIPEEELKIYRTLTVEHTLEALGYAGKLYFKENLEFVPKKNRNTKLFFVEAPYLQPIEIIATGPKYFDRRWSDASWQQASGSWERTKGHPEGGGAVDLAMYVFNVDFRKAVEILRSCLVARLD